MNLRSFLVLSFLEVILLKREVCCFSELSNCSSQVKTYTVMSSGNNSLDCLHMLNPCATLEYILGNVSIDCVTIELRDHQILSSKQSIHSANHFAIIGNGSQIDICCEKNSGIFFESSQQVHLENLNFIDCAVTYNSTGLDNNLHFDTIIAGILFYGGSNISILKCSFTNGSGTGMIMMDITGEVRFTNSNFIRNKPALSSISNESTSGGLIIYRQRYSDNYSCTIDGCLFEDNVQYPNKLHFGGGLTFIHSVNGSTSFLEILHTNFSKNHGIAGGGVHINHATTSSSYVQVNISDCHFKGNNVSMEGGGVWITSYSSNSCVTAVLIARTYFENNSADWGGGIAVSTNNNTGSITVTANDSHWIGNSATRSGTGVGLGVVGVAQVVSSNSTAYSMAATFQQCSFIANTNTIWTAVGAVYAGGARIYFIEALFIDNSGTALYVRNSGYATFAGKVIFEGNLGIHGSAIHVSYDSVIALESGVDLRITFNNAAFDNGGAIYTEEYFHSDINHTPCVFDSLNELVESEDDFSVTFSNNYAHGKLQSIYITDPTHCMVNSSSSCRLMNSKIFTYNPNVRTQIASKGYNITLRTNPSLIDNTVELMLGEPFYIDPIVLDRFDNPSSLYGNLVIVRDYLVFANSSNITLIGPDYISMDKYTKNNLLYIKGDMYPQTWSVAFIYDKSGDSYLDTSVGFQVKLTECKPGFLYNEKSHICECVKDTNLVCPTPSFSCVRYGYWYGSNSKYSIVLPCPGQSCRFCHHPNSSCSTSPGFCLLNDTYQCQKGRNGTLCSHCQSSYSFTFSALSCVETATSCSNGNTALIVFAIFLYWIISILLVFMILSLNLSVGSGFMYGIVYYFSVISLYTDNTVTDSFLTTLVHTCVALTQLCPHAIGDAKMCFAESWKLNLHHQTFHYVTPAFIAITIFAIIWISRFCRCPKRISLAQNSPIHAISILVLFSYCALAYTSFEILKPINIYGHTMVYSDPDLMYFHKQHLPYALLAIFVEFFISLPVCFVLLFAPCLSKRLNLVKLKLKPIVDEFQACYRPECRWFAGFYFLARQLVYLTDAISQTSGPRSLPQDNIILHYLNAIILIVHVSYQPYRLKWLNLLDTLLLSDVLLMSYITIDSPVGPTFIGKAMPYILILLPSMYLLGALIVLVIRRIHLFVKPYYCSKHKRVWVNEDKLPFHVIPTQSSVVMDSSDDASPDIVGSRNASLVDSFYKDVGEREPLLSDSRSSTNSATSGSDTFTTSSVRLSSVAKFPFSLGHRNSHKASTN